MSQQIIPFEPDSNTNFQFQATLDGQEYNCICTFNAYGQRYYINVYDLFGTLIFSRPVIASPSFYNVSLTLGYFDTTVIYRESSQVFEIPGLPAVPLPPREKQPPPTIFDPYFADVVLLLHFDGEDGGQVFTDSSSRNHVPSNINQVGETETSVVLFGTASGYFNGGFLWYDNSPDWAMGAGDWTVEVQVQFQSNSMAKRNILFGQADFQGGNHCFGITKTEADFMSCTVTTNAGEYVITGTTKVIAGQWYAVALERQGATLVLYLDGNIEGTIAITGAIPVEPWHFGIAIAGEDTNNQPPSFGTQLLGFLDEFRLTKGVARYTGGYIPQSAPFPDN